MITYNMTALRAPTVKQFRAGHPDLIPDGARVTQRGRVFRVTTAGGGGVREQSAHYVAMAMGDLIHQGIVPPNAPDKVLKAGDWASHLFRTKLGPLRKHSGIHEAKFATFDEGVKVAPYCYVQSDLSVGNGMRLMLSGAYDAMGLIGSEFNGLALADNRDRSIVADRMVCVGSGWGGASQEQRLMWTVLARLMLEDRDGFAMVVNKHFGVGRLRREVEA